ncbi:MAG TPA: peptidoglycan DD-metalloendopeptidase family protein, partial [bacterium]|nr:peptidoglycan DD-metalloendopeptidase family protein [bacterium]
LAAVERARQARRERLRGRLRALYLHGRTGYVDVLLGSADVGEFVARWQIVSTIVGADTRLIQEYTRDVEEQRAALAALTQAQARLAAIAEETARRRREVEAREEAKRGVLARLRQERAAYERMVRELEEDSRQLEALIRRSQSAGRRRVAMARGLPGFIWPARGIFTSGFGVRRHPIFRIRRLHTGQDIAAPYGAPVVAAADGRVIYTGWFGGYGRIVVLDHGEGVSTLYAHLSQILARSGQAVRKGQAIGRVGSTGYSTGPHVHFEVRVHGTPIDPARR